MSSTTQLKKCQPTKCETFARMFVRFYEKVPVDRFVVNCPYRMRVFCMNGGEKLKKEMI
jgi:hypothetical protein